MVDHPKRMKEIIAFPRINDFGSLYLFFVSCQVIILGNAFILSNILCANIIRRKELAQRC